MLCTNKGSSFNLDLMISGNYVMIMVMLMIACIYMYAFCCLTGSSGIMIVFANVYIYMLLSDMVINDHDCFMRLFICIYVCMYVSFLTRLLGIILVEECLLR